MIIKILKKLLFSILIIYSLDLIIRGFNIIIPINYFTILTTAILGLPGLITLTISFIFLI